MLSPKPAHLALLSLGVSAIAFAAPPFPGAVFTTTEDGTVVNENVQYDAKTDVYLDGGPGPGAPAHAASLPEGDYFFQVTDPSGQDLLSTDHISCRRFHVNADGVISQSYSGTDWIKVKGDWASTLCQHQTGVDIDHAELGAITVQLYPFDDTPNPGGVYKVWVTPVDDYTGDATAGCPLRGSCNVNGEGWVAGNAHGFVPSASKTDNFKVDFKGKPFVAPELSILKFHDANLNGVWDDGEESVDGWAVDVTDPIGVTNTIHTPGVVVAATAGEWTTVESQPEGTEQSVALLDGVVQSVFPDASPVVAVSVAGVSGETHEVVFGNYGVGSVEACKTYDRDANGMQDADEPAVPGWHFVLVGTDVTGMAVGPLAGVGDETGCYTFAGLLPGTYTVTEADSTDAGWFATSETAMTVEVYSLRLGSNIVGTDALVTFTNAYLGVADFNTKGFWHNQNGLQTMTSADIEAANTLAPYSSASSYFEGGDEPFDGQYADGAWVAAALGVSDSLAPEGSAEAEVVAFLVESNGSGDRHEQLAQQLLAFFFNTRHATSSPDDAIQLPDGSWASASELVQDAIDAWLSGSDADLTTWIGLLDGFNNNDFVNYVPENPPTPTF